MVANEGNPRRGRLVGCAKPGIRERIIQLRDMGIRTVMVTGDNPVTAAAIAARRAWTIL